MANTKQAKKRAGQSLRRRAENRTVTTRVRHAVKDARAAAATDGGKAKELLPATMSELDVAVRKGVLHRNTAARLKSRVQKSVNKATAAK